MNDNQPITDEEAREFFGWNYMSRTDEELRDMAKILIAWKYDELLKRLDACEIPKKHLASSFLTTFSYLISIMLRDWRKQFLPNYNCRGYSDKDIIKLVLFNNRFDSIIEFEAGKYIST